jgi:septal ring factor EnvC (AmiA/AmiB activator)
MDIAQSMDSDSTFVSQRIAEIIKTRNKLADTIKPVYKHLERLIIEINEVNHHRQKLIQKIDDSEVINKLNRLNLDSLKSRIEQN